MPPRGQGNELGRRAETPAHSLSAPVRGAGRGEEGEDGNGGTVQAPAVPVTGGESVRVCWAKTGRLGCLLFVFFVFMYLLFGGNDVFVFH